MRAQGVLNWVGQAAPGQDPPSFEARLYDVLFTSQNPSAVDDWLADLNPEVRMSPASVDRMVP